jgi:hypothetical protein
MARCFVRFQVYGIRIALVTLGIQENSPLGPRTLRTAMADYRTSFALSVRG